MKIAAITKVLHVKSLPRRFALVLVVLPFHHVFAQSDTTSKLKEVSVSSTRAELPKNITPAQQIKAEQFIRYSAFNVADAVRGFSGVSIKDYGGVGGLKTVSVRGLGANHTAVLLNNVQLNDAQNGQIDLSKLNLYNVESIVIYNAQPGDLPQPARSFAASSVLNVNTIKPRLSALKPYKIDAVFKTGSFGLVNPYVSWQQRLSNRWSFTVDANLVNTHGKYKYRVEGDRSDTLAIRSNGGMRSTQTNVAFYWVKSDSTKLSINVNYFDSKRGLPGAVIFYNPNTGQFIDNNDVFGLVSYQHIWKNGLKVLVNTKASQLKTRYLDPNFLNQQGFLEQRYNQREFYQSVALAYQPTSFFEVSYAADVSLTKMDADLFNYAYPSRKTILNVVAASYTIGKLRLQANLLQANINEQVRIGVAPPSRSKLMPTLASIFNTSKNFQIRAFYKKIFRAPTLDEIYFYAINNPRIIEPELTRQFNLGFNWTKDVNGFFENVSLSLDGYYNNIANKILAMPSKNPAIFSFSNIGKVEIKGVDICVKTQTNIGHLKGLFTANYSYLQSKDVSDQAAITYGEQLPYTPKHTLSVNTGLNRNKVGLYLNYLFSSSRYYAANNVAQYNMPAYHVVDLSCNYSLDFNQVPVKLSAEINNLFNSNYSVIRNYPLPGRSYRITFQITI